MNYFASQTPAFEPIELDGHLIYPSEPGDSEGSVDFSPGLRELRERLSREAIRREGEIAIDDIADDDHDVKVGSGRWEPEDPERQQLAQDEATEPPRTIEAADVEEHCNEVEKYLRQLLGNDYLGSPGKTAAPTYGQNGDLNGSEKTVQLPDASEAPSAAPKRSRESSILSSEELAAYNTQLNAFREISQSSVQQAIRRAAISRNWASYALMAATGACSIISLLASSQTEHRGDSSYSLSVGLIVFTAGLHLALLARPK